MRRGRGRSRTIENVWSDREGNKGKMRQREGKRRAAGGGGRPWGATEVSGQVLEMVFGRGRARQSVAA